MQNTKPHACLLASPGIGHLIPVLELGKRLATLHGFDVTLVVVAADPSTTKSQLLKQVSSPYPLNLVLLPYKDITGKLDPSAHMVTRLIVIMRESLPVLRSTIIAMKVRPTVLIVDLFGTEAFEMAREFGMLKYVFDTSNAWFLAATAYFPTIDKEAEHEHINKQEPLQIPGCKPLRFEDTLEAFLNPDDPLYVEYLRIGIQIPMADGIFANTWQDLEPKTLGAMRDRDLLGRIIKAPVYPIGPLVRQVEPPVHRSKISAWLDMQPSDSVIYVSFGSGGTLSTKQITELAWGLELSQQRFIWVVRPPMDHDVSGSFFTLGSRRDDDTPDYLPDGFVTRTQKVGLVVQMWAPQAEILGHSSVGGFLSHCGWNSTVESIVNGVPMIAWPLYAEQTMNAALLTEELDMALKLRALPTNGTLVGRMEIEKTVRKIMEEKEGMAMRARVKELKYSGEEALSKGGSSYNSLSKVAKDCEANLLQVLKAKAQGALGA